MSNFEIIEKCKELQIRNFKGVFMRDELQGKSSKNECLILNHDHSNNNGTHWTCLFIKNNARGQTGGARGRLETRGACAAASSRTFSAERQRRAQAPEVTGGAGYYFDSFGFEPPLEVTKYCTEGERYFNTFPIQKPSEVICGHYSIYMLYMLSIGFDFYDVLDELYKFNHK